MHTHSIDPWSHAHVFLGAKHERHERRIWFVVALTAVMMVAEIVGGTIFGSMAVVADGWPISTHPRPPPLPRLALPLAPPPAGRSALYLWHRQGRRAGGVYQRADPRHDRAGDRL